MSKKSKQNNKKSENTAVQPMWLLVEDRFPTLGGFIDELIHQIYKTLFQGDLGVGPGSAVIVADQISQTDCEAEILSLGRQLLAAVSQDMALINNQPPGSFCQDEEADGPLERPCLPPHFIADLLVECPSDALPDLLSGGNYNPANEMAIRRVFEAALFFAKFQYDAGRGGVTRGQNDTAVPIMLGALSDLSLLNVVN